MTISTIAAEIPSAATNASRGNTAVYEGAICNVP